MSEALLTFGHGYVAQALARRWPGEVIGTARDAGRVSEGEGFRVIDPAEAADAVDQAQGVLISAPPDEDGCPGFRALRQSLRDGRSRPRWIGYLSSTSVYGDLEGRWAFEGSPLKGKSIHAVRRTAAEQDWLSLGEETGLNVGVFRLGAIYGPGRSALERVAGGERTVTVRPGQVFSRAHVDDIAALLAASIAKPRPGAVYNVVDDAPSSAKAVMELACRLMEVEPPARVPLAQADLSEEARRFWAECRRVSNARAKAELGWRPAYPSFREGLAALAASFNQGSGGDRSTAAEGERRP